MKHKKILLIALIAIFVGGILATVAWGLGASTSLIWDGGIRIGGSLTRTELNETLSSFHEIELTVGVSNVTLRHGDDFRIEGHHYGAITYEVRNDRLVVNAPARNQFALFGWSRGGGGNVTITVPLPEDAALERASLSVGVGNVYVQNVALLSVVLESGVGDVYVQNVNFRDAVLESGVGNIHAVGLFTGWSYFTSGVGDVTLQVSGPQDEFSYSIEAGVGNVTIDGVRQGGALGNSLSHTASDFRGSLQIESGVGNVSVSFSG